MTSFTTAPMNANGGSPTATPVTVLICALGGEGGGVLAEWLYVAATRAGLAAQSTSIPGVAQRTGATTYYVEIHPEPITPGSARRPVFSLNPVPGAIDLLASSELLETARQVSLGMACAERTRIVSSTARALTVAEKMTLGEGRVESAALAAVLQRHARSVDLLDFGHLAREAGTAISAVLFGALAASGALPLRRAACEEAIRASGKGVEASLRGFALAFDALTRQRALREQLEGVLAPADPTPAPDFRSLGRARVAAWQDAAYARRYDERLSVVDAAERAADPAGHHGGALGRETARWLALWMAFDDVVQVARLKVSAARQARVRRETGAGTEEVVRIYDHFKPGVPEFAALLPPTLARRLLAWDRRRAAQGREPWALPLRLGTHTVTGTLALRTLGAMRRLRPWGSRYREEQALIDEWLATICRGCAEDWALGHELALCGRLVKGYGGTHARGQRNLLHIVRHLAAPQGGRSPTSRAQAVRAAREAALADEAGTALDRTLQAHGAPPRPVPEQVVRFYRRRRGSAA
jgi:indolepyruvate ferredoxin oxidoreductase beta subunit